MIGKKSKILSLGLATAMMLGTSVSFAAEGDYYKQDGTRIYSNNQIRVDGTARNHVRVAPREFKIEVNGKLYNFTDARAAYAQDPNNWKQIVTGGDVVQGDLKVESVSAINAKEIQVKFSQAVDKAQANTASNYTLNGTNASSAVLQADEKTVIVTVATAMKDVTDAVFVVKPIKEKVGTETTEQYTKLITYKDTVAPTAKAERVSAGEFKVVFSEPVQGGTITAKYADGTAVNTDADGIKFTPASGSLNGEKEMKVTLGTDVTVDKEIVVTLNGVKDMADNLINPQPTTVSVVRKAADTIAPKIASVTQTGARTFNIKFDKATTLADFTANGVEVGVTGSSEVTGFERVVGTDNEYKVTVGTANLDGIQTVTVKDGKAKNNDGTANNADLTKLVTFTEDKVAPKATAKLVNVNSTEYIELTFDKDVDVTAGTTKVAVSGNQVKDYITTPVSVAGADVEYKNANNKKVVLVKLNDPALSVEGAAYDLTLSAPGSDAITSLAGEDMENVKVKFTRGVDANTAVIKAADVDFKAVAGNNDQVEVEFTVPSGKSLDGVTATNIANYTVDGAQIKSTSLKSVAGTKQSVILTLEENSNIFTGVRNATVKNVKISGSTKVMDPVTKLTASLNENVRPTVTKAELTANNKITLTISEIVSNANDTAGVDFDLYIGNTKSTNAVTVETIAAGSEKNTLEVTLTTALTPQDVAKGISLKSTSALNIADMVGNELKPVTVNVTTN